MSINFNKSTGNEIKSSAHSKYRCQYHIVFAPKYRRNINENTCHIFSMRNGMYFSICAIR